MAKRQSAVKKVEVYFYGLKTDEAKQVEAAHIYDIISPFLRKRKATAKGKKDIIPADSQIGKGA